MTLNITVLTHGVIYQSADFRLVNSATGELITDRSAKISTLTYPDWRGLITYTGLGGWGDKNASEWITAWLARMANASASEVAGHIATRASAVLDRVRNADNTRFRHTFTLAAYEKDCPRIFTISNHEDCFVKNRTTAEASLSVTTRALGASQRALVIVTGQKNGVGKAQRRLLGLIAGRKPTDAGAIRRNIQELNSTASRNYDSVSEACEVISLRADGSSIVDVSSGGPGLLPGVMGGIDMSAVMKQAFKNMGIDPNRISLVQGASSATSGSKASPDPCKLTFVAPESAPKYVIREWSRPDFELRGARGVNRAGSIVGTGCATGNPAICIPWLLRPDGTVTTLGYAGIAAGLNNDHEVVGISRDDPKSERAVRWNENTGASDLGLYAGGPAAVASTDSGALDINDAGDIIGSIRNRTLEQGRAHIRTAVFRKTGSIDVFEHGPAPFDSRPIALTQRGLVLLVACLAPFDVRSILWDSNQDSWSYVGENANANVFPVGITEDGLVLGQARDKEGSPIAVVARPKQGWQGIGTQNGWPPTGVNNRGEVVGWGKIGGLVRPWIRLASGEIMLLPYAREHHTTPTAINDRGDIVGGAGSDHGSHVVVWSRAR